MKRAIALVAAGGLIALAALMPAPEEQLASTTTLVSDVAEPSVQAFALCPWASTEGNLEGHLSVLATGDSSAVFSYPSAGEIRYTADLALEGLSGVTVDLSTLPFEGLAPVVAEFTSNASVGVLGYSDTVLVGSGCVAAVPRIWVLPGGSTRPGDTLELQLFNPFPEDARLNVAVTSEAGFEPEESLEAVTVNARSWRTIDIAALLPLRESLAATIEVERGVVIPAFLQIGPADRALWTGVGRSDRWEFPLAATAGLEATLVLSNPNALPVEYAVGRVGARTTEDEALTGAIEAGAHVRLPLADVLTEPSGLEVQADGLIGAVILGSSETVRAATGGAAALSSTWLIPGLGSLEEGDQEIWFLNTSAEQISVTYSFLDQNGTDRSNKVAVAPRTSRRVVLSVGDASGVFVEATAPVSVGAAIVRTASVAYLAPVPLDPIPIGDRS